MVAQRRLDVTGANAHGGPMMDVHGSACLLATSAMLWGLGACGQPSGGPGGQDGAEDTPAAMDVPEPDDSAEVDSAAPSPPGPGLVGTHHITEFWPAQALLDETGSGPIRINIGGKYFKDHMVDPASVPWDELDPVVQANGARKLFVTVYVRHGALGGNTDPKIPVTEADVEALDAWARTLVARYADQVDTWQLENEITLPSHWPPGEFAQYAALLVRFHDVVALEDPDAHVAPAGFKSGKPGSFGAKAQEAAEVLGTLAAGSFDTLDLHHHRSWLEGPGLAQRIDELRAMVLQHMPDGAALDVVVTENSTWMDKPDGLGAQSEGEQAIYAVQSVYAALGAGAAWCTFGTLMDRTTWKGEAKLHKFNLNGLFYNPEKAYSDGTHEGPKAAARVVRLLTHLTADVTPADVSWTQGPVTRVEVGGPRPHVVLWTAPGEGGDMFVPLAALGEVTVLTMAPSPSAPWPAENPLAGFPSETVLVEGGHGTMAVDETPRIILLDPAD